MADKKISALTASTTPLAGTEVLPIVQSGSTVKVAVSDLTAGRAVSMLSLTADTTTLVVDSTNHRVGVGTASPSYNVDIKGVAGTNAYVRVQSNNAGDYSSGVLLGDTVSVRGSVIYDQYYNLLRLSGNSVECLNMGGTGDVKVLAGNLVIGTSGQGIDFSATPGTGTSELLNDYEEGDWTPNVGGNATYTIQTGRYVKVGKVVTVWGHILINTIGTGNLRTIFGLPFTAENATAEGVGNVGYTQTLATAVVSCVPQIDANTTNISFMNRTAATANTAAVDLFQNSARMYFTVSYRAA
jgi:hypothetical protein